MARSPGGVKLSYRTVARPCARWITMTFIMIIGWILWVGVLSDSSGRLTIPGSGSIVYVVAVIGVVALLAYVDRKRD